MRALSFEHKSKVRAWALAGDEFLWSKAVALTSGAESMRLDCIEACGLEKGRRAFAMWSKFWSAQGDADPAEKIWAAAGLLGADAIDLAEILHGGEQEGRDALAGALAGMQLDRESFEAAGIAAKGRIDQRRAVRILGKVCLQSDAAAESMIAHKGFWQEFLGPGYIQAMFCALARRGYADWGEGRLPPSDTNFYAATYLGEACSPEQTTEAETAMLGALAKLPANFLPLWAPCFLAAARGMDDETATDNGASRLRSFKEAALALAAHPGARKALNTERGAQQFAVALEEHLWGSMHDAAEDSALDEGLEGAKALALACPELMEEFRAWLLNALKDPAGEPFDENLAKACTLGVELCKQLGKSAFWLAGLDRDKVDFELKLPETMQKLSGRAGAPLRAAIERETLSERLVSTAGQAEPCPIPGTHQETASLAESLARGMPAAPPAAPNADKPGRGASVAPAGKKAL